MVRKTSLTVRTTMEGLHKSPYDLIGIDVKHSGDTQHEAARPELGTNSQANVVPGVPGRDGPTLGATKVLANGLDWLTPPIHEARADDRCRQFQQRLVDIQPSFKADSQFDKACKPAVRPLNHPPVFAQPLAALNASSGNSAHDAPLPQADSAPLEVVAFVGVQLCRSSTGDVLAGQQSQESRPRTSRTSWSRAGSRR